MLYRMFQEPEEVDVDVIAAKLDHAQAQQRSAIRRQPTVRHFRYSGSAARERVRERIISRDLDDEDRREELQIAQIEAELARLRSRRQRHRDNSATNAEADNAWRDADELLQSSRSSFRDEDALNGGSYPPRLRDTRLPRPDRQSGLRFEVGVSTSPRRRRLLSPPSSSGSGRHATDALNPGGSNFLRQLDQEPDDLTPGFAPARYYESADTRGLETPPPETWESLPPLSRSMGRPERPSQRGVDGLGDRHRSPTPDPTAEEETWAHLLTQMDDGRSTANTSFASNGDSNGRSRGSNTTAATSFGEIPNDDSCDLDMPPGISEETARYLREQHRSREQRPRRNLEPDGPVMTGEQGLRMHENRLRQRSTESRPPEGRRATAQMQMQMIQHIMERFGTREDVPDDWWTIMGWDSERDHSTTTPPTSDRRLLNAEEVMQELNSLRAEAAADSDTRVETTVPDAGTARLEH